MKVQRNVIEAAILKLITQITQTMPNSVYQFVMGGATTFATMKSSDKINQFLNYVSDENGLVDVDMLEKILEGSFSASNNVLQLEFFKDTGLLSMFIKPVTVKIQKQDIDELLKEIKANSVSNEVSLSKTPSQIPPDTNPHL